MNEGPYKEKHLEIYQGILTSTARGGSFKMELKVEDNPVLKRSVENIESSIELEFHYSGTSTRFLHDVNICPRNSQNEQCRECENIERIYHKFKENLEQLQVGDTFQIRAALINNDQSELQVKIHFEGYKRIEAACSEYWLRLPDTPEGIKKKQEVADQRLQREQDEKEQQRQAEKVSKRKKRIQGIKQFLGERPLSQIIISVIGGVIAGIILTTIVNPIPRLFQYIYHLLFPN